MAGRALGVGDKGADVEEFQRALRARSETRFYPPVSCDGVVGPQTMQAFRAIGWALGLTDQTLNAAVISPGARAIILTPETREAAQLQRAGSRGPKLHLRTVGFDGAPTYWGLAKALLRAREHGWSGKLAASDRRAGVPEQYGKKSQATLYACAEAKRKTGRCPPSCGGECNPANKPGASSHEQRSDGSAFPGPVGRLLNWWELGLDVSDNVGALHVLSALGYHVRQTYPGSRREAQHINFTADPGRVLPTDGPAGKAARHEVAVVHHAPRKTAAGPGSSGANVALTGPDVSLNQPDVDWKKVKAAGHDFAIAKVSDGLGTPDSAFGKGRWKAMKDAGLIRGAYHFGRPQKGRRPEDEVADFLQRLKVAGGLQDGDLVPVLDLEKFGAAGRLTPKQTLEWARGWTSELRRRIGRHPIIYTGVFWRETMGNPGDDLGCPLWLAAYVPAARLPQTIPAAWKPEGPRLWQHTDKGTCPGIPGKCDMNRFDGPRTEFDALRL
jgi:lysozyme